MSKSGRKHKFGEKIRAVRERKGFTLKEVAAKAAVSESLVSQIERNKVSPSVDTLLAVADALEIDYEYLFRDHRQKKRVTIVRADQRQSMVRNKVSLQQLSVLDEIPREHSIEAFLLEIAPGGEKGDPEYGHSGREFGVILEGSAQLDYGYETYELNRGDTVSFQSDIPHLFKNSGDTVLKAIWVVTPPRRLFRN